LGGLFCFDVHRSVTGPAKPHIHGDCPCGPPRFNGACRALTRRLSVERRQPGHVRLSDLEGRFVCWACGTQGADIRPDFNSGRKLPTSVEVADRGWSRPFDEPIPLPRGRQLVTLEDAGNYIAKLPKAVHEAAEWEAVILGGDARRLARDT
jgi:hypothetical protein